MAALFDFLKKKKGEVKEPAKKEIKKAEKKEKPLEPLEPLEKQKDVTVGPRQQPKQQIKRKKVSARAYKVLYSPHITEKAADFNQDNKYVFKVWPRANKIEIKGAVEGTYGVDVVGVRIINIPRRKRRLGRHTGWKKGYKKAIVKIKKGQKIEILPR